MSRRPLAPIVVTARAPRVLAGELGATTEAGEVWAARTVDGRWSFEREDVPGTPWVVLFTVNGRSGGSFGTLPAARAAVASGEAERTACQCRDCEGNGRRIEWRVGPEHARGFFSYRKDAARVVSYAHRAGPCEACHGSGQEALPAESTAA